MKLGSKSKGVFAILAVMLCTALFGTLMSCSGTEDYTVFIDPVEDCVFGDTVTVPEVTIKDEKGNAVDVSFAMLITNADGDTVVPVDGKFIAEKVGKYTIAVSVESGGKGSITFNCSKALQNTVSNFAVSLDGEVTFTEVEGETYSLYCGTEKIVTVTSGMNIKEYFAEGINEYAIITDGRGNYADSVKSNIVTIEKINTVKDLAIDNDYILSFTENQGVLYLFFINDSNEAVYFNSGDDILNYLDFGDNKIVIVGTKTGAVNSDRSESFTIKVNNYLPLGDVEIEDGIITFTETSGLNYKLFVDGEERGDIKSGDNLEPLMLENEQLTTTDIQVRIEADTNYGASRLSNSVKYFYNQSMLGQIVYSGTTRTYKHLTNISHGKDSDNTKYIRFVSGKTDEGVWGVSVKFDTPLSVNQNEDEVYYLRIKLRASKDLRNPYYGFNRGSVGLYDYPALMSHMYNVNYLGEWYYAEIQVTNASIKTIEGFYLEINQIVNNNIGYLDVAEVSVTSYKPVETGLGTFTSAERNKFGFNCSYWAVPYKVEEINQSQSALIDGMTYNFSSVTRLYKDTLVTSGGNTTFGENGTTTVGTYMAMDLSQIDAGAVIDIVLYIKAKSAMKLNIEGYYGSTLKKDNIIDLTEGWQKVVIGKLNVENLSGICLTTVNFAKHYAISDEILIGDFEINVLPLPPLAENFSVSIDGTVNFTGAGSDYTYNLVDENKNVLKSNIENNDKVVLQSGYNIFAIETVDEYGLKSYSKEYTLFKSNLGYGTFLDTTRSALKEGEFEEKTENGISFLRVIGKGANANNDLTVLLPSALNVPATGVSYLKLSVRFSATAGGYRAINNASFFVHGKATLATHIYGSNYRNNWFDVEIQLNGITSVEGFVVEIQQVENLLIGYVDIASVEIVTYEDTVTPLGTVSVASKSLFGIQTGAYWSVPYESEYVSESVTVEGNTYGGYIKLKKELVTFGGNTTWANQGTSNPGAMVSFSTSSSGEITVAITLKITSGTQIAICGYNSAALDKTSNVITGTGEWQTVEITVNTSNLSGICFVAKNTNTNWTDASEILIAAVEEVI